MKTRINVGQAARLFQTCNKRLGQKTRPDNMETGAAPVLLWLAVLVLIFNFQLSSGVAQPYSIDWYKIAGGGGTSSNGQYSVTGTIGQHDASTQPMSGGNYSLTGGFWALISVVQTPGLPDLIITHAGYSVVVSWPDPATNSYTLQQNGNLSNTGGWTTSGYVVSWANGTNHITINPPKGNLFFRLKQ